MKRNLDARLARLESALATIRPRGYWRLAVWLAETRAGVSHDEQERRRLAEYPHLADRIRADYALGRRQLADIAEFPEIDFSPDALEPA